MTALIFVKPGRCKSMVFSALIAHLRTWFHTWSWIESLARGATTFTSQSCVSAWVRAASSSLHKHLVRCFPGTRGYLYRGDRMGLWRVKIVFHMRYCNRVQLKLTLLCRVTSSLEVCSRSTAPPSQLCKRKGGHSH